MANILYLGSTPLIDLSAYATESYVDAAVANVDVTDQLNNYVEKELVEGTESRYKVLSENSFTDALLTKLNGLSNYDDTSVTAALNAVKSTLADITTDGSTDAVINTWTEIKNFLVDYSTANDLKDIIDTVESTVESTVKTWVGNQGYLTANDVSTFVTQADIDNSLQDASTAIGVLDTSVNAIESDYVKSNDISTFITAADVPTVPTTVSSFTNDAGYQTANDVSTKITSASVLNVVTLSQADYNSLTSKDASTLYIVL